MGVGSSLRLHHTCQKVLFYVVRSLQLLNHGPWHSALPGMLHLSRTAHRSPERWPALPLVTARSASCGPVAARLHCALSMVHTAFKLGGTVAGYSIQPLIHDAA
jgi:hypothetical protein